MITPQSQQRKLAKALGLNVPLYFKREDLHPLLSHKGRSIPTMINEYQKKGIASFVISSSGNAALAAGLYIKQYNKNHKNKLTLQIFVGEKIDQKKLNLLNKIQTKNISIIKIKNPKQEAFKIDKARKAKILRQSTDDLALKGYHQLAKELSKIKKISAIFIPTSSGTTAQGLYDGFKKIKLKPQIYIVQTTACYPLAKNFFSADYKIASSPSIAGAIVDKVAHRKEKVVADIKNSHGFGWVANNKEIKDVQKLVYKNEKIRLSNNSALAIVGLTQALKQKRKFNGPVVCLITGQ